MEQVETTINLEEGKTMILKRIYLRRKKAQLEALASAIDERQQQASHDRDSELKMIIRELRAQFVKTEVLLAELRAARRFQFKRRKKDFEDALNHTLRLLEQTRFESVA